MRGWWPALVALVALLARFVFPATMEATFAVFHAELSWLNVTARSYIQKWPWVLACVLVATIMTRVYRTKETGAIADKVTVSPPSLAAASLSPDRPGGSHLVQTTKATKSMDPALPTSVAVLGPAQEAVVGDQISRLCRCLVLSSPRPIGHHRLACALRRAAITFPLRVRAHRTLNKFSAWPVM